MWAACSDRISIFDGRLGLVGLAKGLREDVRGGGAGGVRLLATFESSSEFRSGTGGLPMGRGGCGGLVSVSDPEGYEWRRLRLYEPLG